MGPIRWRRLSIFIHQNSIHHGSHRSYETFCLCLASTRLEIDPVAERQAPQHLLFPGKRNGP